ncbi:hypothetical protein OP864_07310 [Saprospira grandis]|nr:hypothetical protein [Saprospira grandis]WBM76286.1 hypothetical protein OP864_07310 [Saprospira grandis]
MCCFFWGCPALRAGRAVSQLAGLLGPAGFFALLQKPLVCPCGALLSIPQPAGALRPARRRVTRLRLVGLCCALRPKCVLL